MNKLEKIELQEQKTREKIAALQGILKQIDGQRTEQENLQIVQQVRALKLSRDELYAFITGGEIPATLAEAITGGEPAAETNAEPETIYTRRDKKRRHERETEPDAATPEGETDTQYGETATQYGESENTNFESEGMNHEDN
jgi:hypothetical protein